MLNNPTINMAAMALGRLKATSSIGPLIDALITIHRFKVVKPGGDGSMSTTFGTGPSGSSSSGNISGMSAGGGPTFINQAFNNQAVLDALVAITGQNFDFDQQSWRHWFASQKKRPDSLDGRRDQP